MINNRQDVTTRCYELGLVNKETTLKVLLKDAIKASEMEEVKVEDLSDRLVAMLYVLETDPEKNYYIQNHYKEVR